MPEAKLGEDGTLRLPAEFVARGGAARGSSFWVTADEAGLHLLPRTRDLRKIYVEPTTVCNLHCRTCIRNVWDDAEGEMTAGTFERLLESLHGLPAVNRVVFTGFGEPFSHPRILEMVQAVRERGLEVSIGSNGLLMDRRVSRELIRLGVDRLVVSLDGIDADTYADIRGGAISQVLENVRALNEEKSLAGSPQPLLGVEFVALRSNVGQLPGLVGLAGHLGAARVLVSNVLPYTEGMRAEVLYGYEPHPGLSPRGWPVMSDKEVMWGTMELPRMYWGAERRCRFVRDRAAVVGWDGAVTPCYALAHSYSYFAIDGPKKQVSRYVQGNVNEQPLADIWMSEQYVRFRGEVLGFHFPSCPNCDLGATCDLRERNEGCWGWNPSCADCLWAQDIVKCP